MNASDSRKPTAPSDEVRRTATAAFDALTRWRDELTNANERCLTRLLDQMAATQRAMGWPDRVSAAARDNTLTTFKMQAQLIDQTIHAWKHQLDAVGVPSAFTQGFSLRIPALSETTPSAGTPDISRVGRLPMFSFEVWMHVAEMWRRNWTAVLSDRAESPPRPLKKAS